MSDLANPPKLIYLPTKDLIQRMILRSCFLKKSILYGLIPNLERKHSLVETKESHSSSNIKS